MKYLLNYKKYNLNESNYDNSDLNLDESIVEEYYDSNYEVDEENYKYMGTQLFQFMDENKYMTQVMDDFKGNYGIDDYDDEDDFRKYINLNSKDFVELVEKLLKEFNLKELIDRFTKERDKLASGKYGYKYVKADLPNYIKDADNLDNLDELDFDEKLDLLSSEELKQLIIDNDDSEYVNWSVDERYSDVSVEDFLSDMGYHDEDLYEQLKWYIDTDELNKYYKDNENYDYKLDFYLGNIGSDEDIQNKVLEYDNKNAIYLFDIMDKKFYNGRSEYFQQMYIDEMKKENSEDYENETEWANEEMPGIMKDLYDKFGLDEDVKRKYLKYTKQVVASEFNL